jgi:glycosyltransferase involved in cell wall biosynthesis
MYKLSVIIPTYNRCDSVLRALEALSRQTYSCDDFEAVVISDGSTDGTAKGITSLSVPFRLRFIEQRNLGPSVARNHGARTAASPLLVYMDDDIEPVPEFLEEHAREHSVDDGLVLIGPQSGPENEPMSHWVAWEHRMLRKQYAKFSAGIWEAGPNNLYSGNFSVLREHLLAVGGFNEEFTRQEDVELGFRLAHRGLHFRFNMRANGIHRPTRSFESWYRTPYEYGRRDVQMAREGGEERAIALARKHFGERNGLTRLAARACIGRAFLESALLGTGRAAVRFGGRRVALAACSVLFNLRYLQGMSHELGGRNRLWAVLATESTVVAAAKSESV